jgi:hypothetical protein
MNSNQGQGKREQVANETEIRVSTLKTDLDIIYTKINNIKERLGYIMKPSSPTCEKDKIKGIAEVSPLIEELYNLELTMQAITENLNDIDARLLV